MKIRIFVVVILVVSLFLTNDSFSQSQKEEIQVLKEQVQLLLKRVETLEKQNNALLKKFDDTNSSIESTKEQIKTVSEQTQLNAVQQTNVVSSKYGANLYGYVKLDSIYDDSHIKNGNYALYANSEAGNNNDNEFNITANQTRFGLNLFGPEIGSAVTDGKIEIDFYGGGAENKPHLRMRHAYAQITWPEYEMSFLAGQTFDVIAPLYPSTLNFLVDYGAGNIGYRRPQIRFTKNVSITDNTDLLLQTALTRTIGDTVNGIDTGTDSGFPSFQSRVAYSFPLLTEKSTTLGVSGHYGQEQNDSIDKDLETWSINLDLKFPIFDGLGLKSEFFTGANLDTFYGGILQGVNTLTGEELRTTGGWAALSITPMNKININLGASMESLDDYYVPSGGRTQNSSYFGNIYYMFDPSFLVGAEVSYWDTQYKDLEDGDALRFQTSVIYKF